MLTDAEHEERKQKILHDCLDLFVQQGLENTSMNDLSNYSKTYKAAVYHYFKSKDEIVYETAKLYMSELKDKLQTDMGVSGLTLCDRLRRGVELLAADRHQLRFVYQVISSPKYGERSRKDLAEIYIEYLNYSELFAKAYGIDHEAFRPFYLLYVATMHDFCLWEHEELVKERLEYIYKKVDEMEQGASHCSNE